jgi:hypothetical protein
VTGVQTCALPISQRLGIAIFTGVPAIMGGGIVYALTHKIKSVAAFVILLYLVVFTFTEIKKKKKI